MIQEKKLCDTFCILPFKHMQIGNTGLVRLCCQASFVLDEDGEPLSVYNHSSASIWNSKFMRETRRALIEGKRVAACGMCWQQESNGAISKRMVENDKWQAHLAFGDVTRLYLYAKRILNLKPFIDPFKTIKAEAARNDFFEQSSPVNLEFEVGNVCNLMCRMCSPDYSSRIESDPVHSKWHVTANPSGSHQNKSKSNEYPLSRLPEKTHWFKEREFIYGELLKQPKSIQYIIFKGGEPFVSKEALDVLAFLRTNGDSSNLTIAVVTNGTVADAPLLHTLARFKRVAIAVSLDGVGSQYEYIRYPAKWNAVEENLRGFSKLKNTSITVSITIQAYNVLNLVEIFRHCDRFGYRININILNYPAFLSISVIPPTARRVAAERIREYVKSDCRYRHRKNIGALATALESAGDEMNMKKFHEFMLFTNDLDQSRNQSFREIYPELFGYFEGDGFMWSNSGRFTRHDPLTPDLHPSLPIAAG